MAALDGFDIKFDFNLMMRHGIGNGGISQEHLDMIDPRARKAHANLIGQLSKSSSRIELGLEWANLHNQPPELLRSIAAAADRFRRFKNVIFLGIGGSFLGLKAAQDALARPYFNDLEGARGNTPRIYFEGKNLDPSGLHVLLENLNPAETGIVVISKSGETTETAVAFEIARSWLMRSSSVQNHADHIVAVTGSKGALRTFINSEAAAGRKIPTFDVFEGVGGRFSEFNVGLFHLALIGIDLRSTLGAYGQMIELCKSPELHDNPALQYAVLQTVMSEQFGRNISVIMPFSDQLESTAKWYVQLLAESLGKKHDTEGNIVNKGRTPVPAVGTSDLHSIQQNNVEGMQDKVMTLIGIENFEPDIAIPSISGSPIAYLAGRKMSEVLKTALQGTAWALMMEGRPSCAFWLSKLSPKSWAAFLALQMMAVAYEGQLIGVNAYDQPGVESYKKYVYVSMGKPNVDESTGQLIKSHPVRMNEGFII